MADLYLVILGILVFLSSLISVRLGLSVSVIEIVFGVIAGNLGIIHSETWMIFIASFGGILLTFLSGTEIDVKLMREKFKETFLIGFLSFLIPFILIFLVVHFLVGWNLMASLLAGTALSETSIAVVYSTLLQQNLFRYDIGKILMGATFITNICTAIALSILFTSPNIYIIIFYAVSILLLVLAFKYSYKFLDNSKFLKEKVLEIEIKYIFLLLFILMFFAALGGGQAILPVFILGMLLSNTLNGKSNGQKAKERIKTVAFAVVTPVFFIVGGMKVSIPLVISGIGIFILIFAFRQVAKFIGVYFVTKKYLDSNTNYVTLMMSTGLTFGLIATLFGLNIGLIDTYSYSILTGVLVLSAVLPTIIAQKWFTPKHLEDLN
ncbi:MAG: cation:proton antiporter [Methanobrevibacter sp.]|nr:cation:proton antiporter [Methanobrevibacter sp.]MEA4956445.1 cation:proton antiporter [Methanobrevibacter sp.]